MLTTCAPPGARPAPVDNGGADDDRPTRTDPHRGTRYIWPARARRVCCRKYRSSPRQALICTLPIGLSVMKLGGERAILAHDPAAGSALGRPQVQDRPGSMPSPRSGSMSMPGSGAGSSAPPSSPPASSTSPRVAPPGCSIWSRADPGSALQTWLPTRPDAGKKLTTACWTRFRGYATALGDQLPDLTRVLDPFYGDLRVMPTWRLSCLVGTLSAARRSA